MTEWLIEIEFDADDREPIERLLAGSGTRLVDSDGMMCLRDPNVDELGNPCDAEALADRLVRRIRALVQMVSGHTGPECRRLWLRKPDGQLVTSVSKTLEPRYNIYANVDLSEWSCLLRQANSDSRLARALDVVGKGVSQLRWSNLYVLLDVIREDVGGLDAIQDLGWATQNEVERFKYTANSHDALRDEARHGMSWKPPKNPMSLVEARQLLSRLLRCWLEWRRNQSAGEATGIAEHTP